MEKQTLGEIAAQKLLGMIQDKGYTAGDKLPTEAELVERLGVGRNTVREALRILMSRNICQRHVILFAHRRAKSVPKPRSLNFPVIFCRKILHE